MSLKIPRRMEARDYVPRTLGARTSSAESFAFFDALSAFWATAWAISRRGSGYDGIMSGTKGDGPANGNGGDDGSNDDDEDDLVTVETGDRDFDQDLARYAPPPPAVAELCAACVRFVATKYKIELDFTSDTL